MSEKLPKDPLIPVSAGLAVLFALLICILTVTLKQAHSRAERWQQERKERQEQLTQAFAKDVEQAKAITADPCWHGFYKLVQPPAALDVEPRLVVFGEEVGTDISDPSKYEVRGFANRVEFWTLEHPPGQEAKKLGMKYNVCK